MSSVTHQINLATKQPTPESIVHRINKVIDSIEFFESLPPKELLDLIKQQMEKHSINLDLVNGYHLSYADSYKEYRITNYIGPITQACQVLWTIINELENKCNPDLTNNQPLTQ